MQVIDAKGTGMRESVDRPERVDDKSEVKTAAPATGNRPALTRLIGLQRAAGNAAVAGMLAPTRASAPVVVQRVAAQLGMAADGVTIASLTIRGRPPSPHKSTMGDHTTAYIVQVRGVRDAVQGKNVPAAVAGIQALVAAAAALPGVGRSPHLPRGTGTGHGERLDAAAARMQALSVELGTLGANDVRSLTTLQHLVTAYLAYRELIPLTTLNIREISAGLAGRAKGESGPAEELKNHATLPPAKVAALIVQLLDTAGVALLATQPAETAAKVAPGVDPADRVKPILRQHARAIQATYPGAIARAWTDEDNAVVELGKVVEPLIQTQQARNVELGNGDLLAAFHERINYQNNLLVGGSSRSGALEAIENKIAYCTALVIANGGVPVVDPATVKSKRVSKQPDRLVPGGGGGGGGKKRKAPEPKTPDPDPTHEGAGSPTATQLTIGPDGRITEVLTEGRPPSPFDGGRMGAHTTAWIAHKDVIRTTLVGSTIPQAAARLRGLGKGVDDMAERLKSFGTATRASMEAAMATRAADVMAAPVPVRALVLQAAVGEMLADVNLLPGSAFDVVKTTGDVEGAHRGVLMEHERDGTGDKAELQTALVGLLDMHSVTSDAKRLLLVANHQKVVMEAYPRSCATSGVATMSPSGLLRLYENAEKAKAKRRKTD